MIDKKEAESLYLYDPESGIFLYKKSRRIANSIFTDRTGKQYIRLSYANKRIKAHRVAFILMGVQIKKSDQVDHIDGNGLNNKFSNLRIVSNLENAKNQKVNKRNKSGIMGVYFSNAHKSWRAQIYNNGKKISLGGFSCFFDACCARKSAEIKYGYHSNHGSRY